MYEKETLVDLLDLAVNIKADPVMSKLVQNTLKWSYSSLFPQFLVVKGYFVTTYTLICDPYNK